MRTLELQNGDLILLEEDGTGVWLTRRGRRKFNSAAYLRKVLKDVELLEDKVWIPSLREFFNEQADHLSQRMSSRSRRLARHMRETRRAPIDIDKVRAEATAKAQAMVDEFFDEVAFKESLADRVTGLYEEVIDTAFASTNVSLGIDFLVQARESVQELIVDRVNQLTGHVSDSTYKQLQRALRDGILSGRSIPDIAKSVRTKLVGSSLQRATVIARTEVISAYNGGVYETAVALPRDIAAGLLWITTKDARTRPAHLEADGQTVEVGEPFIVGGQEMKYPGDPAGGADNTIQCRCSAAILTPEDFSERSLNIHNVGDVLVRMALYDVSYRDALWELRVGNGSNQYIRKGHKQDDDGDESVSGARLGVKDQPIGSVTTMSGKPLTERMLEESSQHFITVAEPETFSGWKAHIYATDVDGVHSILRRLDGELASENNPGGWGAKVATKKFMDDPLAAPGATQHGKAVTVYYPNKATAARDIAYTSRLMADLPSRQKNPVTSEEYVGNGVSKRYELSKNAPNRDLSMEEYHKYYRPATRQGGEDRAGDFGGHSFHGNQYVKKLTPSSTRTEIVGALAKAGYTGPTSYTKDRLLEIAGVHGASPPGEKVARPDRPGAKKSRSEMLKDLEAAGYKGPTSYTKERLAEIHAKHVGEPGALRPAATSPNLSHPRMPYELNPHESFLRDIERHANMSEGVHERARVIRDLDDKIASKGIVCIDVPAKHISSVLSSGRVKSQHETRSSRGMMSPKYREEHEKKMFGEEASSGRPPSKHFEKYPVYGHVLEAGGYHNPGNTWTHYGEVKLVMHDSIKARTTFTAGDSLGSSVTPVPIGRSHSVSDAHAAGGVVTYDRVAPYPSVSQAHAHHGYIEAQIHGGVHTSQVAKAVVEPPRVGYKRGPTPSTDPLTWARGERARMAYDDRVDAIISLHEAGVPIEWGS